MRLYHIHKASNEFDYLYYPGSKFTVGDEYNSMHQNFLKGKCVYLDHIEQKDDKEYYVYENTLKLIDLEVVKGLNPEDVNRIVDLVHVQFSNMQLDLREAIFEEVRYKCYASRPSRYTCMWLTDEESLKHWLNLFNRDKYTCSVYEMEVDGNLFLTNSVLLPRGCEDHELIYQAANRYWNPKEEDIYGTNSREYIFEGNVKVLRQVK